MKFINCILSIASLAAINKVNAKDDLLSGIKNLIGADDIKDAFNGIKDAYNKATDAYDSTKGLIDKVFGGNDSTLSGLTTPVINSMWIAVDKESSTQAKFTSFEDVVDSFTNSLSGLNVSEKCAKAIDAYMETKEFKGANDCINSFIAEPFDVTKFCDKPECYGNVLPSNAKNDCLSSDDDKKAISIIELMLNSLEYATSFQCSKYVDNQYCGVHMMKFQTTTTKIEGEQTIDSKAACACYAYAINLKDNENYDESVCKIAKGLFVNKENLICDGKNENADMVKSAEKPEKNFIDKAKDGVTGIFSSDSTTTTVSKITLAASAMALTLLF
ncbi:hypothetical protein BCR36DRAFT_581166 [Piromyces finnis]|uniref:Uncharacterized protein n=1 Tax=Piromyces finnis TaxID=1754191 RepID=A0A1Y1VGZ3_9FUNG|nr:hypothetical protein BCR36DRAFT_581166 [Piromyces finnis]|eukprot:ORX55996.1 hypothetical protein BCR36DRAFT_581166 [Piromyces finnis]